MDTNYICKKLEVFKKFYDTLATYGIPTNSTQYIESLTELGLHVANADGVIDSRELQAINDCLGTNLTPTHYMVSKVKNDTETNFLSAPPISTAVCYMADIKLGTGMKDRNWDFMYEFCYAIAMSSGGRGSKEDIYAYDYFDKILATGLVMGQNVHPKKRINELTLQDIERSFRM